MKTNIRPLAMYLPQFHPIDENDNWWGKGFTEWTNVARAKPKFINHYQPHLPADLGFYDLRSPENLAAQAELASKYGIYGFLVYHYWFTGKRLLEKPIDILLANRDIKLPFTLCWANENWTRKWDGGENEVLIFQEYSEQDDLKHFYSLLKYFEDDRYIKIDGKPVFTIYRTNLFPDIKRTVEIWRNEAHKIGYKGLYLMRMQGLGGASSPEKLGFDANIDFQPDFTSPPEKVRISTIEKLKYFLKIEKDAKYVNNIYNYSDLVYQMINRPKVDYKLFPGITPSWDNTARRKDGATIFRDSTPELYGNWLNHLVANFEPYSKEENFVFINAWNEWAEGNHLEPCRKWGLEYLEMTKKILDGK